MAKGTNWSTRFVAMVFTDGYHTIHTLNIKSPVRMIIGDDHWIKTGLPRIEVPIEALEVKARKFKPDFFEKHNGLDLVGVFVADWSPISSGQIVWAVPSPKKASVEEGADNLRMTRIIRSQKC